MGKLFWRSFRLKLVAFLKILRSISGRLLALSFACWASGPCSNRVHILSASVFPSCTSTTIRCSASPSPENIETANLGSVLEGTILWSVCRHHVKLGRLVLTSVVWSRSKVSTSYAIAWSPFCLGCISVSFGLHGKKKIT